MKTLAEFVSFLNDQAEYHGRQVIRHKAEPPKKKRHEQYAADFKELACMLQDAASLPMDNGPARPIGLSAAPALTPDDLAGLPEELLKELNISESDAQDMEILKLIDRSGGTMSLDKLLIAIYRQTGEIHKRPKLTARLYRMTQKGILWSVPKKKGVYTTTPLGETTE